MFICWHQVSVAVFARSPLVDGVLFRSPTLRLTKVGPAAVAARFYLMLRTNGRRVVGRLVSRSVLCYHVATIHVSVVVFIVILMMLVIALNYC